MGLVLVVDSCHNFHHFLKKFLSLNTNSLLYLIGKKAVVQASHYCRNRVVSTEQRETKVRVVGVFCFELQLRAVTGGSGLQTCHSRQESTATQCEQTACLASSRLLGSLQIFLSMTDIYMSVKGLLGSQRNIQVILCPITRRKMLR